jgi:hypothetical protein
MLWRGQQGTGNIEDRRGLGGAGIALGGGGCGTLIIIILALLLGVDPSQLLNSSQPQNIPTQTQQQRPVNGQEDELKEFSRFVLGKIDDTWMRELPQKTRRQYRKPTLVLFTQQVRSACGIADSGMGPFYCPGDEKLYLDFAFFSELKNRFRAPGDFAQAYVIAHEVGHHIQKILGTTGKVDAMRGQVSEAKYNDLSVRLELQADFYAGVWAHYAEKEGLLEAGDIEEALRAAAAVGDDTIQRRTQGYVIPDSFTHGTSEQRMRWFRLGFQTGDLRKGDTFSIRTP